MLDCESINSSSPLGLDLGFLLLFERKSILFKSRRLSGSFQSTRQIIEARWSAIESWRTVGRKENFDHLPTTLGSLFDFFLLRHKGGLRLFLLRMRIQNHFLSLSSDLILSEILQVFDRSCCVWPEPGCEPGSSEFLLFSGGDSNLGQLSKFVIDFHHLPLPYLSSSSAHLALFAELLTHQPQNPDLPYRRCISVSYK